MLKFKDLNVGDIFEFNRSSPYSGGEERGPWVKVSARTYRPLYASHRLATHRLRVGTVRVSVMRMGVI